MAAKTAEFRPGGIKKGSSIFDEKARLQRRCE
jgi:hypothetical protein